jgi:hypothetical protein
VIEIEWSLQEGVQGYSVEWSENEDDVPDEEADLSGDATGTRSPRLAPGTWYFHLRTQGENGDWTSTVHVGPFEIEEEEATPVRTSSPTVTPTTRATPVLTPDFGTPPPPPTPAPTPEPPPPPTAAPTPPPTAAPTPPPPTDTPVITTPTP